MIRLSGKNSSLWRDSVRHVRYPRLERDLEVDVAVVGGGITGLTTALLLKRAGKKVAVLELHEIGAGASGHTSAHLTACLDRPFETLVSKFGQEGARAAAQASLEAIDFIESTVRDLSLECGFERVPGFRFTENPEHLEALGKETDIARSLGLPVSWTQEVPVPFPVRGAIRFDRQAQFHPVAYLEGLAAAVDGGGSAVFEHTKVLEVEEGAPCLVSAHGHLVRAGAVIEATHTPINLVLGIQTRVFPYMTYVLGLRLEGQAPAALLWDTAEPYHYLRRLVDERGEILIVGGMDHKTGQEHDIEARFKTLLHYASERFPVASVDHYWSQEVFESADGLPYIGRKTGADNVYVAGGFSGTGLTFGTLSGMILCDLILGREHRYAATFSPSRIKPIAAAKKFIQENLNFAWHLVADRLHREEAEGVPPLPPCQGRVMDIDGRKAAVYRDEESRLHVMSAVCTHAGCIVNWNPVERTWDCPCHGGRYLANGKVLCSPPTHDLRRAPEKGAEAVPDVDIGAP